MFKRSIFIVVIVVLSTTVAPASSFAGPRSGSIGEFMIADFNTGDNPGNFSAWSSDPADPTHGCTVAPDSANKHGDTGFAMKLKYDVDSRNPANNGFRLALGNIDARGYDNLALWLKGDGKTGYTTVFKTALRNAQKQEGSYYITNITDNWQEIIIPLSDFKGLSDISNLTEFVIAFEDKMASNKEGIIYIDDLRLTKNK